MLKSEIRQRIRTLRRHIDADFRLQASQHAADLFIKHPLFVNHQYFACYMPQPDEMDTMPIIRAIWKAKKFCYLPVLSAVNQANILSFVLYQEGDDLIPNRYKILEPSGNKKTIPAKDLEVVLTPLVAFDNAGNRLGTGGGFYDRTFAFLIGNTVKKPLLIGMGYELQHVDALPHEPFDVKINGVITETGISLLASTPN